MEDGKIYSQIGPELRPSSKRKYFAIVSAARAHFLEFGYGTANMHSIAVAAGVSKRTVYKHFRDKQALFAVVVRDLCATVAPPSMDDFNAEHGSVSEALTKLGVHILTNLYSKDQIALFRVVVSDANHFPGLGKLMFEQVAKTERLIGEYLLREQDKGNLILPCPEIAASQFLGLLKTDMQMRLLFRQRKRVSEAEIRKISECCVTVFLHGAGRTPR